MPRRYDLLVIDLDGTLLRRDGSISPGDRDGLRRAANDGMEVVIATGRARSESLHCLEQIGFDGLMIAAGGSLLCDAAQGRTIERRLMAPEVVREVTAVFVEHGHKALILKDAHATGYDYLAVGPHAFDPASSWWFDSLPIGLRHVDDLDGDPHPDDTIRAGVVASRSRMDELAGWLEENVGDRILVQHWPAVTSTEATGSATHLLEVFEPTAGKWSMIERVCESRAIDPGRVAVIGDGLNDVGMVRSAALGVAMANADPRVMAVADRVTKDHDADGVANAIDEILSGGW